MGSLHGVEHRRIIEGAQGAQVDDICLDAFGGELLGGVEGGAQRATVSDDGDVVTVMTYRSSLDVRTQLDNAGPPGLPLGLRCVDQPPRTRYSGHYRRAGH
jgi:hypothetical protein